MFEATVPPAPEPIAIIGIGCRFPGGVTDAKSFWTLMCNGVDAIGEVPADRWSLASFYHAHPGKLGTANTRWGGFLNQRVDEFDAQFFGISPREAAHVDPMQRWLLEVTWEALEDSGHAPEQLAGSATGVFIGAFIEDIKIFRMSGMNLDLIDAHTGTGAAMTMAANRLSYVFDLRGPSLALDTACSSSLVAVHLACQSLWNGESSLAIAGGANAMFQPEPTVAESKAGMLSPDGRCKTWDASANGYVRAEGAGVVVLKPLSRALADGDPIYALVRGTAVNQDGRTIGITVPSQEAQEALMQEACRRAGISPGRLRYVEAHGTGTPVGDPIEANALAAVLAQDRPAGDKCIVGSVKTNFGHLEAAAGIAGLIKVALCLKHRQIPPNLHFKEPNPRIPLNQLCVRVPQALELWPDEPGPALASVNSFGFGGTNAHAVLEEAPSQVFAMGGAVTADRAELIPLSARSPEALRALARSYRAYADVDGEDVPRVQDIAYSAALRRGRHDHRLAVVVQSGQELIDHLDAYDAGDPRPGLSTGRAVHGHRPKVAFIFSGMGPQWWAMGRHLLEQEPVFRTAIEQCDRLLTPYTGWSLVEEMQADEARSRMGETQIAQPANFALQVALAALWRSWGITPDAIVGHSAGEVAAAYLAGVMSLEEATRVIFHRSRLQHRTTGQGKLVAVGLSLDEARQVLRGFEDRVSIAAVNSPSAVTLVGDPTALEQILEPLRTREVFNRYLAVDVPYHSHYMDTLREELLTSLRGLVLSPATLPLFSTVTGRVVDGLEFDAEYWWRNVREPVLFAPAVSELIVCGYDMFLELSPHPVLSNAVQECLALQGQQGTVLHSLRRKSEERATILTALGTLFTLGYPVDFAGLHQDGSRFVRLPAYPWQRLRHWDESPESARYRIGQPVHPLLGQRHTGAHPTWETSLDTWSLPFLGDHRIQGTTVFPGAAYIEMGLAAGRQFLGSDAAAIELGEIEFRKALFLPDGADAAVQVVLNPHESSFDIYSRPRGSQQAWTRHARGVLRPTRHTAIPPLQLNDIRARCPNEISSPACYRLFSEMGLQYGPTFQGLTHFWKGSGEAIARIGMADAIKADLASYHLHPAILDACFQALIATVADERDKAKSATYMPIAIDCIRLHGRVSSPMWAHTRLREQSAGLLTGDVLLCDDAGNVIVEVEGVRAQALDERGRGRTTRLDDLFYDLQWELRERPLLKDGIEKREPGGWLILADGAGVGRALATRLEERGESVVMAFPGRSYLELNPGRSYQIDPARPEDIHQLLAGAFADDRPPCRGVIHLWALDASGATDSSADSLQSDQDPGCITVMHTVQALIRMTGRTLPKLWLVTRGARKVGPNPAPVAVAQAPLWGLARTIGLQEHAELWGGIVDLDPTSPDGEVATLFDEIWDGHETDQIAFRGGKHYSPRLVRRPDLATVTVPVAFRADGSYLITGGLGGIGLELAGWMIRHGARSLILMGRSPIPARTTWHQIEEGSPAAARVAAVRRLEALGACIHVAAVDVTDEQQLASYLQQFRREGWPPIRGMVHSAGVTHSQLLMHMDRATFLDVQRPKIRGAWLLHQQFKDTPLDFFVLFSSVASLGFSMGLGSYASGNAFLDALAHYRRSQGLPAVSVNWGPWAEVGMAGRPELAAYFTRRGLTPLPPEQGIEALALIFSRDVAQAAVMTADWPVIAQQSQTTGGIPRMLSALLSEPTAGDSATEDAPRKGRLKQTLADLSDLEERTRLVETYLAGQVVRALRLPAEPATLPLAEPLTYLGIDSLIAVELNQVIEAEFGVAVSVVSFLEGGSITSTATRVLAGLAEEPRDEPGHAVAEQEDAERLTEQIDQLSDAEVDALFSRLLVEGVLPNV